MQERFKFRAWEKNKKFMIYDIEGDFGRIDDYVDKLGDFLQYPEDYEVMQCTGLKDNNGKLIYEGDIVKVDSDLYDSLYNEYLDKNAVITYREEYGRYNIEFKPQDNSGSNIFDLIDDFYYFLKWEPCGSLKYGILEYIKVIGNIYENPELLEN